MLRSVTFSHLRAGAFVALSSLSLRVNASAQLCNEHTYWVHGGQSHRGQVETVAAANFVRNLELRDIEKVPDCFLTVAVGYIPDGLVSDYDGAWVCALPFYGPCWFDF